MKNLYAFSLVLALLSCISVNLTAQNYEITFSGSGMSTVVQTVRVWNLTADTTFTMNGNDTLILMRPMSAGKVFQPESHVTVFPNPATNSGTVSFINPASGQVVVELTDLAGRVIASGSQVLSAGEHSFTISNIGAGVHLIRITNGEYISTAKWITSGSAKASPVISWLGHGNSLLVMGKLAGVRGQVAIPYEDGDQLMFRGTSGNYQTIVTAVPTQSMPIDFGFVSCTDIDNNHYPVVVIGTQTWMAANLRATKYNNGTPIPEVTDFNSWANTTTPAYCWYNNDPAKGVIYGALYKWQTVDGGNLCPAGWRVPAVADWTTLISYLGGDTLAGGKIKETGTLHWDTLMPGTSNASGFTALPAGMRSVSGGAFQALGNSAYFWTSQDYSANFAHMRYLTHNSNTLGAAGNNKGNGFSVRCIKD